ncbi:MAG: hypothetical protein U0T32_10595 [Chitinophagales bacterium]
MKKALIKLSALATIGLVMASCSNEEANKKAAEADNAAIQTLVDSKTAAIDAEVSAACDAKVTEAAQAVVDSLSKAKPVAGAKKPVAPVKKAPAKPAPAKPIVKEAPKTTNSTRPGTNETAPKSTNESRAGTNETAKPATNKSRPGAN